MSVIAPSTAMDLAAAYELRQTTQPVGIDGQHEPDLN